MKILLWAAIAAVMILVAGCSSSEPTPSTTPEKGASSTTKSETKDGQGGSNGAKLEINPNYKGS